MPGGHAVPSFLFLRNRPLLVTSPTKLKNDFNEVEDVLGRPYSIFGWGQMTGLLPARARDYSDKYPLRRTSYSRSIRRQTEN